MSDTIHREFGIFLDFIDTFETISQHHYYAHVRCRRMVLLSSFFLGWFSSQTEADPQVISLLMEREGYGDMASRLINVAGHRVTTDPLAIPFSMGRNLFW